MSTVFTINDPATIDLVNLVLAEHHPKLAEIDVKFKVIQVMKFDKDDEPIVPSLKHHGAAAAGAIKVTSLKQRHLTGVDFIIELDGHVWKELPRQSRLALIDHELTHLVLVEDKDGKPATDDIGRPKLKTRPDDWTLTGFASVISRHGNAALEYQSVNRIFAAADSARAAFDAAARLGKELKAAAA